MGMARVGVIGLGLLLCFSLWAQEAAQAVRPPAQLLEEGLRAFHEHDYALARKRLSDLDKVRPNDRLCAYYLGLIELRAGQLAAGSTRLRAYAGVDLAEARINGVLTLLTRLDLALNPSYS